MSSSLRNLIAWPAELVQLLPLARLMTFHERRWRRGEFRIICQCQVHARQQHALWRRSLRAASRIKARGIALIVGVPLALGTLQFPTEAMNIAIGNTALRNRPAEMSVMSSDNGFAIFNTPHVREQLLESTKISQTFTLELVKEQFFNTSVPYGPIIYREAVRNGLAPELVAAVIEAESDFRPRLVSSKNALGLMQIVPETGRLMGAEDLFNPGQNIAAGTKYLRYLLERFPDQRMALAAYNAGEGNVERFGGIPPFPETVNYLQRVSSSTAYYRQRIRGTYVASVRMQNSMTLR
jgi:soluble lytic murein transglycosylase-like protein